MHVRVRVCALEELVETFVTIIYYECKVYVVYAQMLENFKQLSCRMTCREQNMRINITRTYYEPNVYYIRTQKHISDRST